jgi:hypothetical protein
MRTLASFVVLSCSATAFLHFLRRVVVHARRGVPRAAAVSFALAMMSLGPLVSVGLVRGLIKPRFYGLIELASVAIAALLVTSIFLVEVKDQQRRDIAKAKQEASDFLARYRKERGRK